MTRASWFGSAALAAGFMLTQGSAVAASAENGERVFMRAGCWQCHGTMGQGGAAGPKLAPDPLPFDALSSFVRTSNREMPAYRQAILSDADLADLYAYLQSIPKGPDPKTIPLLNRNNSH
jgi:ubiquinol-cytochrome c reductase cytochrome c subunit